MMGFYPMMPMSYGYANSYYSWSWNGWGWNWNYYNGGSFLNFFWG